MEQNGFVENFIGRLCDDRLNKLLFASRGIAGTQYAFRLLSSRANDAHSGNRKEAAGIGVQTGTKRGTG